MSLMKNAAMQIRPEAAPFEEVTFSSARGPVRLLVVDQTAERIWCAAGSSMQPLGRTVGHPV
jgi:hypothetical protein